MIWNSDLPHHDSLLRETRMPFGKYQGVMVRYVPRQYLRWFLRTVEPFGRLEKAIRYELFLGGNLQN